MKLASLSTSLTRPETIWQWLCLLTLVFMRWVSREQLGVMFAEIETDTDNGALLVYDHDGNGHVFLPDDVAGRYVPYNPYPEPFILSLSKDEADQHEETRWELDVALMKPSCCDAPEGLSHYWYRPNCIGAVLPFRRPAPVILDSS